MTATLTASTLASPFAPSRPARRPPAALAVAVLHLALAALLLHQHRQPLPATAVLPAVTVSLLTSASPALQAAPATSARAADPVRLPPPPSARETPPAMPAIPAPLVDRTNPVPSGGVVADAPAFTPPPPPQALDLGAGAVATPAAAVPAPAAEPHQPQEAPPGAIRYRVPPAVAVPLASRRLRESGVVWLRVHVDTQGLPVQIQLHRSSGHARLDEQALAAMQAARFEPRTEHGQPVDWVVLAPIAYEVD